MRRPLGLALAVAVIGIVGWLVGGAGAKEVVVVYDLAAVPDARALEVTVLRGGEVLRRAEFRVPPERRVSHALKLSPGEYRLRGVIERAGGTTAWERPLEAREDGTVVLALGG